LIQINDSRRDPHYGGSAMTTHTESDADALPIIMVAVRDNALREAIGFSLAAEGYQVRLFSSGEDLLAAEGLADVACFVVNQRLPKMTGLSVIETVAERGLSGRAVVLTTRTTEHLRTTCRRLGVPILEKPILGESLNACIRGLLAHPAEALESAIR
jgi:FixJ family two-component response regulator